MKRIVVLFWVTFFYVNFSSAEVPDCWNTQDIKQGSYLIGIETEKISKEDLIKVLDLSEGKYLRAAGYPIVFDEYLVINTEAFDPGIERRKLTKEELQKIVEKILKPIAAMPGVSISCNAIVTPF